MRWRLLRFEAYPASLNMAIDEAVAEGIRDGDSPPTLRFYRWRPSAVSIGCFQSVRDEVDLEECQRRGVEVVRRRTGGGAVYHDEVGEVTYSVLAPASLMGEDITASYREVCGWVMDGLRDLGLETEYRPINDITLDGRKISGCAQTRREGVFLQHGTVLHSIDREGMFSLLRVGAAKLSDKPSMVPGDRVTAVAENCSASMADLYQALQRSFCQGKEWSERPLSGPETRRAYELARVRYSDREWTYSR